MTPLNRIRLPIFFHVYIMAPPRYRLAGRKTGAREDNTNGSLVDTHRRDKGENSDQSRPESASWWRSKRRKNFPSPIVTTVAYVMSRFKSQSLAGALTSTTNRSTFSLGCSLLLPELRLYLGSTILRPLFLLLVPSGQCPNPGLLYP